MAGRQAGCIGLLTVRGAGCLVRGVVAYDENVVRLAAACELPVVGTIADPQVRAWLRGADLLVCVHGRERVPNELLALPRLGGINVHPCLSAYPGARPIERFLADGGSRASVGVHRMTDQLDAGPVILEEFVEVAGLRTLEAVYHALYPWYAVTLTRALQLVNRDACAVPR